MARLKIPARPEVMIYELYKDDKFTEMDLGHVNITVHTDKKSKYFTVDVILHDEDGWAVQAGQVCLAMPENWSDYV